MKLINAFLYSALLGAGTAQAQTIVAIPSAPVVSVGDLFTIDLVVSGLGDTVPGTLGTFDLDFMYDPTIMTSYGVTFGGGLDVLDLGTLFSVLSSPGWINLFQTSFDDIDTLVALQPDTFTLATLSFKVIGQGTSMLELFANAVGDAEGASLPVELGIGSVTAVPEPTAYAMLLAGLGLVALAARRRG